MEIIEGKKQLSNYEKNQIAFQVKAELIEHLYQGCLPGTISGVPVGIAVFVGYYNHTSTFSLITWYVIYNLALLSLTVLYFFYKHDKQKKDLNKWLYSYGIMMSICATIWGASVFLMPDTLIRQYFAFIVLFMVATGYATGSIGVFELCVTTLLIIVTPLIVWCFLQQTLFYNLVGSFSIMYIFFMCSINRRSTKWFKESLELKLENTLVSYQVNHDLLTNLPNQRLLPQYLDSVSLLVADTDNTFALVSFSLNRMEIINDTLGHQASDKIVQAISTRLTELAKDIQKQRNATQYIITISRKDTFNIIVVPVTQDDVEEKVSQLFTVLDDPIYFDKQGIKVTASLGVSLFNKTESTEQSLLIEADAAMMQAKQFGGNRLELFRAEIRTKTSYKLELEHDLYYALKNNQLQLYYQPLIDINADRISGMEALIRWPHPVHGMISPARFIPVAEETGLIVPIGEWVLEEACRQTRIWHEMGFNWLRVAVNLSEKQFRENEIIDVIDRVLLSTNLHTNFLELEITETSILDENVGTILKEFKNMGLSLAVDDFGTGYAGLSYLKRFSIDKLKIDQSFIRDIPLSSDSMTIVSAIIAMAKELNVKTLAEGVETIDQLNFLKAKYCDYVQGYYYSKPLEANFFTQLLMSKKTTNLLVGE